MSDAGRQAAELARNAVDVLPEGQLEAQLEAQLAAGRELRVKFGIDPTASDIHLGHTVVLQKLRQFQDQGHRVVLIIGDFTGRVGDPSGRSAQRPLLSGAELDANADTFQLQAFGILDRERTEVRRNGEWLDMKMEELFRLAGTATVARLLERDDFTKRMAAAQPISLLELLYPVLQGYDSVAVRADIELGGTDQKFNLLFARDVQGAYGQPPQSIMTMPILPGTDGHQRMSKSAGNYIGVTDAPEEMFGKLMRVPDVTMELYYRLLLGEELPLGVHPGEAKRALGRRLVERFHGSEAAASAESRFDRVHIEHGVPEDVEEAILDGEGELHLPALLAEHFQISRSEARRTIEQGGVRLDGDVIAADRLDIDAKLLDGKVLQLGKRRFRRFSLASQK